MLCFGQIDQVPGLANALNQYGIATVLAVLMIGGGFLTYRIYSLFCDEDKGLLVTGHKQMLESIALNSKANEANAQANAANARANEMHADAHRRTSKTLGDIATHLRLRYEEGDSDVYPADGS